MTSSTFWLQPESRRLEFEDGWPGGDKIARTAIAFANCAGGRIVFGVRNEPREVTRAFQVQIVRADAYEAQEAQVQAQEGLSSLSLQLVFVCDGGPAGSIELFEAGGYETRAGSFKNLLSRLIDRGLIKITILEKPRGSKHRYRITPEGRQALRRAGK